MGKVDGEEGRKRQGKGEEEAGGGRATAGKWEGGERGEGSGPVCVQIIS